MVVEKYAYSPAAQGELHAQLTLLQMQRLASALQADKTGLVKAAYLQYLQGLQQEVTPTQLLQQAYMVVSQQALKSKPEKKKPFGADKKTADGFFNSGFGDEGSERSALQAFSSMHAVA